MSLTGHLVKKQIDFVTVPLNVSILISGSAHLLLRRKQAKLNLDVIFKSRFLSI